MTPFSGRLLRNAILRASSTSSVRMWSAKAHPTTRRLARSITVAILWNLACQVPLARRVGRRRTFGSWVAVTVVPSD